MKSSANAMPVRLVLSWFIAVGLSPIYCYGQQVPKSTERGRVIAECLMQSEILSGIMRRHNSYRPKSETLDDVINVIDQRRYGVYGLVIKQELARRWARMAVEEVYSRSRNQSSALSIQNELSEDCVNNPDIYLSNSLVDWDETDRLNAATRGNQ